MSSSFHAFSGSGVPVTLEFNNNGIVGINGVNGVNGASVQLGGGVDVEATGNGGRGPIGCPQRLSSVSGI